MFNNGFLSHCCDVIGTIPSRKTFPMSFFKDILKCLAIVNLVIAVIFKVPYRLLVSQPTSLTNVFFLPIGPNNFF